MVEKLKMNYNNKCFDINLDKKIGQIIERILIDVNYREKCFKLLEKD